MHNKTKLSKLKKLYVKIPSKLLNMDLHPLSISIYLFMASCAEDFNPSVRHMARKLKMTAPTIIKYVAELENRNIIKRLSTGGIKVLNRFSFNDPSTWKEIVKTLEDKIVDEEVWKGQ